MPDSFGVPEPNNPDDYRAFLRGLEVVGIEGVDLKADGPGLDLLREALEVFEREFTARFG